MIAAQLDAMYGPMPEQLVEEQPPVAPHLLTDSQDAFDSLGYRG